MLILLCKFEAEVSVPRYLQQITSQLDPFQGSHTSTNEVRVAQPSYEEQIIGLGYEGKMNHETQSQLPPGCEGPGSPKSTLVPEMRWTDPKPTHNMLATHPARDWWVL